MAIAWWILTGGVTVVQCRCRMGTNMDHYAADAAAVVEHLDLRNRLISAISTGGGEATRYVASHGPRTGASLS
jgi:pimeloyl-ACP methyl ester carboxylesterase